MTVTSMNAIEGEEIRFYRDTEEIRAEIRIVREKIDRANQAFNVRQLLVDLLYGDETAPAETAGKIQALFREAEKTSGELRELLSALEALGDELSDAKRALYDRL